MKVLEGAEFGKGELMGISKDFYTWLSCVVVAKQGTILKSFFLSQLSIEKDQVEKLVEGHSRSISSMTKSDWIKIASTLKYDNIPFSWYIVSEEYTRYCSEEN